MMWNKAFAFFLICAAENFAVQNCEAASALLNMDLVMKSGDSVASNTDGKTLTLRGGKCTVGFPPSGNFNTNNGYWPGGWDSNQNVPNFSCPSGSFTYTLQTDGNFVTYCDNVPSYATLTAQSVPSDGYFLAIDNNCVLHLFDGKWVSYPGKLGTNDITRQELTMRKELWINVRTELKVGDRLNKGDTVVYGNFTQNLILQSADGNLVLYPERDPMKPALWAASKEWKGPPASNMKGYYAKVTTNGHLILVGVDYTTSKETIYFDKTLANYNGQKCFTVQYDATAKNLKAVTCPTSRRNLLRAQGANEYGVNHIE